MKFSSNCIIISFVKFTGNTVRVKQWYRFNFIGIYRARYRSHFRVQTFVHTLNSALIQATENRKLFYPMACVFCAARCIRLLIHSHALIARLSSSFSIISTRFLYEKTVVREKSSGLERSLEKLSGIFFVQRNEKMKKSSESRVRRKYLRLTIVSRTVLRMIVEKLHSVTSVSRKNRK